MTAEHPANGMGYPMLDYVYDNVDEYDMAKLSTASVAITIADLILSFFSLSAIRLFHDIQL